MSDHRAAFPPSAASVAGAHHGDGGEAPPSEAALRALRQGRAETAQRIGEHLYRMIMGGLLHDPAVIAACRPLYEMEQQILRMEAALGTTGAGAGASPPTQTALPVVAAPSSSSSPMQDREEMSTAITPGQRPAWQSGPPAGASSGDHVEDASHTSSSSSSPSPSPSSVRHMHGAHAADRLCGHCRMPLKATDRLCPVCGRDTADAVSLATTPAESTNCVRCHTVLRPHDHLCPVCGTARGG